MPRITRSIRAPGFLAFALVAVSCGGPPTEPPPPLTLTSLVIYPKPGTVEAESSIQFSVTAKWSDGSTRVPAVAWSATGGTVDNTGLYTAGTASGTFQVTVSASGKSDVAPVSITPRPVKATLCIGEASPCVVTDTIWLSESVMLNGSCSGANSANKSWPPAGTAPVNIREPNTPTTVGLHTFTYNCTGEGGTDTATVTVMVEAIPPIGERVTRNRPDEMEGNQTQFFNLVSADGPDRGHDVNGQMKTVINSVLVFLAGKTGKIPVIDTYGGQPDIPFVRSPKTHAELVNLSPGNSIILALLAEVSRLTGDCLLATKKCIIFYEPTSPVGVGGSAILGGPGGGVYPSSTQWNGALVDPEGVFPPFIPFGRTTIHELFHAFGAVGQGAPHGYLGHVTDDQCDLMFGFPQPKPLEPQECITATGPEIDRGGDGRVPGDDWYGDNVPAGIFNAKFSPFLIPAPPEMVAMGKAMMQAPAFLTLPTVRYEFREELIFPTRP